MRELTRAELVDAIESLRRTARWTRAERDIRTALEIERIADAREAELAALPA